MIPVGLTSLLLSLAPGGSAQFSGILRLLAALGNREGSWFLQWDGERLDLRRRRRLRRVLICGHGSEESPGFGGFQTAPGRRLTPELLRLPSGCRLYLMGCYQGGETFRQAWAAGTGAAPEAVLGSEGETESALSTCLLLHVMEDGLEALDHWFPLWVAANRALRPLFGRIRSLYGQQGGDPLSVLQVLRGEEPVREHWRFFEVVERYPQYLTGLA